MGITKGVSRATNVDDDDTQNRMKKVINKQGI